MANHYPQVEVFVTKKFLFRARIKETKDSIPYEVNVGGKSWDEGKGREFEILIVHKMKRIVESLEIQIKLYS